MKPEHYFVETESLGKFSEYPKAIKNLERYLKHIEEIFPIIEDVFGQKWKDDYIYIELTNKKNKCAYNRPHGDKHIAYIGFWDDAIQNKNYPENLWGCLLHETLHAFMNPIIHGKSGGINYIDWYYSKEEPFVYSFQAFIYLRLKDEYIINNELCDKFLNILKRELDPVKEAQDLYERYLNMFKRNPLNFSKFINILASSPTPLLRESIFLQDLDEAEKALID